MGIDKLGVASGQLLMLISLKVFKSLFPAVTPFGHTVYNFPNAMG